ncbi:MAG TPA: hypothetical protein HPP81_04200 [Deltaproteobacteria bacterium]|jgi:hypothetical protein|nr:hypothetical protein [Deltaproteobacteria bacterium]
MLVLNDYLGLSRAPRVLEAAIGAMRQWGTGPRGSRFLCGNTTLYEALEERLAAFAGKKRPLSTLQVSVRIKGPPPPHWQVLKFWSRSRSGWKGSRRTHSARGIS